MKEVGARKIIRIVVVLAIILLQGCTTKVQTLAYDKPVQENQASVLIIPSGYTVTNFDREAVKWMNTSAGISLSSTAAAIKIPSGIHTIRFNYYRYTPGQTTYEQRGNVRIQKTTYPQTTSFERSVVINMTPGNRYVIQGYEIRLDTDGQYDQLP